MKRAPPLNKKEQQYARHSEPCLLENMIGRVHGPMNFRLVLQPLTAAFFAVRDGTRDAHEGRPANFWTLFTDRARRPELLANGWKSVGKVFLIAFILDGVYQLVELRWFYPGEAVAVAFILALVPYILLRGPVNRFTPHRKSTVPHGHGNG